MNVKKLRNNPFQHFVGIEVLKLGGGKSVLQLELKEMIFNLYELRNEGLLPPVLK